MFQACFGAAVAMAEAVEMAGGVNREAAIPWRWLWEMTGSSLAAGMGNEAASLSLWTQPTVRTG
jgi:hypothetical protein